MIGLNTRCHSFLHILSCSFVSFLGRGFLSPTAPLSTWIFLILPPAAWPGIASHCRHTYARQVASALRCTDVIGPDGMLFHADSKDFFFFSSSVAVCVCVCAGDWTVVEVGGFVVQVSTIHWTKHWKVGCSKSGSGIFSESQNVDCCGQHTHGQLFDCACKCSLYVAMFCINFQCKRRLISPP